MPLRSPFQLPDTVIAVGIDLHAHLSARNIGRRLAEADTLKRALVRNSAVCVLLCGGLRQLEPRPEFVTCTTAGARARARSTRAGT